MNLSLITRNPKTSIAIGLTTLAVGVGAGLMYFKKDRSAEAEPKAKDTEAKTAEPKAKAAKA